MGVGLGRIFLKSLLGFRRDRRGRLSYLLPEALDEDGADAIDRRGFGAVHFDDVTHMFGGHRFSVDLAVAAWVVFFRHQDVERAVLGEQPNGLAIRRALLAAGAMRFAVLAELQIAREVDNLADDGDSLSSLRRLVHGGFERGGGPHVGRLGANGGGRLIVRAGLNGHFRVKDAAFLREQSERGYRGKNEEFAIHSHARLLC
jgi:hypothetical protein